MFKAYSPLSIWSIPSPFLSSIDIFPGLRDPQPKGKVRKGVVFPPVKSSPMVVVLGKRSVATFAVVGSRGLVVAATLASLSAAQELSFQLFSRRSRACRVSRLGEGFTRVEVDDFFLGSRNFSCSFVDVVTFGFNCSIGGLWLRTRFFMLG